MKLDFKTRSLNFAKAFWPLDAPARKRQIFWLKRAAIAFGLLLIVANLFSPARHDELELQEGDFSNHDIVAPFDFPVLKYPEALKAQQDSAELNVLAIAYRSPEVDNKILGDVDRFLVKLSDLREEDEYLAVKKKKMESWGLNISPATVNLLLSLPELYPFQQGLRSICRQAVGTGILPLTDDQSLELGNQLVIRQPDQLIRIQVQDLATAQSLPLLMKIKSEQAFPKSAPLAQAAAEAASGILVPNLNLDLEEVNNARALARHNISLAVGQVVKGERLVAAYQKIDAPAAQKLYSLKIRLDEIALTSRRGFWRYLLTLLSRLLALGFFLGILIIYLYRFRPEIFNNDSHLLLLASVLLLTMLGGWAVLGQQRLSPYLIPAAVGPMIIGLIFDVTLGAVVAITSSLLLGVVTGFNFPLTVVMLASGAVAAFAARDLRGRLKFIVKSFLAISLMNILAIAAVEYLRQAPSEQIEQALVLGPLNAALSVVLALVLLPLLETIFRATTDYSLLELADPDQSLLKRLSLEAPGTFQHSLLVGNLAEAAALAIGANSLQARIMGYYHDAGKLTKPDYFIENQNTGVNRHDGLAPKMSHLVLVSHVKDGVEMARQKRLPQLIVDAIAQHHGTTLSKYFYLKAIQSSEGGMLESDFRYPGPRPQSKEIGLVMLADVVEATVRSLKDHSVKRMRKVVQAIIAEKANQLELDESNLTLHELKLTGEAFMPVLTAVFHPRIEYPQTNLLEEKPR
jgi:putative nucleotidyltransferase with HDIG domain